ncbi:MAG: glutamine--fructose-6-phosphate transaminase (isomerizing) [Deltaproteobacteria bacterium]|nr:MAG: glutamine--fructose-6-phosphate transaminase (isomerizing) [Deltaproteobacteria bacterium]
MCGIVGYLGPRSPLQILMEGLHRLEYRGYDSAGVALFHQGAIEVRRAQGKLSRLEDLLRGEAFDGRAGIGHTRWATHGRPSDDNAHPHKTGRIAVVHNGIIENYLPLKEELKAKGRVFTSGTDTEVIAHLIDEFLQQGVPFREAVKEALNKIRGSYALGILCEGEPQTVAAARKESPLVIGLGDGEFFIASDTPAVLNYTRDFIFLEDGDIAFITPQGPQLEDLSGRSLAREPQRIHWSPLMAERGGYKHFMLKEIHEQPAAVINTIRGRITEEEGEVILEDFPYQRKGLEEIKRVFLVACGTSWHAALVGAYLTERLSRIPAEVDIGSEFRYRDPLIDEGTLLVAISQSGETADTLAATREARRKGGKTLSICNVLGSSITRETEGVIYTHAGPEIGVASTKAFTSQMAALFLLALHLGRARKIITQEEMRGYIQGLVEIPGLMKRVLEGAGEIERLARKYVHFQDFLYLGRGVSYPIALEGALKLKEISYIHAEGYPAGEMKHGPIALIDEDMPVVVVAPKDHTYEKVLGNIEEVKARDGRIIALATDYDPMIAAKVDEVISVPTVHPLLSPFLTTLPLQLLAYYIADFRGTDIDQPRNLAKSVTVE